MVRGEDGGPFELRERYGKKRLIGRYRSAVTLRRGIERYGKRVLLGEIEVSR
jgi:hypothetical protein